MVCPRCGTSFEGNFCPRCGTPAAVATPPASPAFGYPCPRCGTVYQGNFCPRCGLPFAYAAAPAYRPSTAGRSFLSVVWTLAIAGFLILVLLNLVGLYYGPTMVAPGIQNIDRGASTNPGLDAGSTGWSFTSISGGSVGSVAGAGGNPGPYLEMQLSPGSNVRGMWTQTIVLSGSTPYAALFRLDVFAQTTGASALTGRVVVALDTTPGAPSFANETIARTILWVNASTAWTTTDAIDLSGRTGDAGTYYLKVAFVATTVGGATTIGFDNLRLTWLTDAAVILWLPLPLPDALFVYQDPTLFLGYYGFLIAAITAAVLYHTVWERKSFVAAFTAPLPAIGKRLRSMNGWIATAQAWMAVTFFQVAVIFFLIFSGETPTTPIEVTPANTWVLLFDLANASVYEELVYRLLLIGVPMALGSLLWNATRATGQSKPPSHSLRYFLGGHLRKESSNEALLVGWILLFVSSGLFGAAHAPGWGWWKVLPALVAGLGFGYLFLRHGIGAAILAHFATDYISSLSWEGIAGSGELIDLLFLALALIGAGFFAWYILYAWEHLRDLGRRLTGHKVRPAAVPPVAGGLPQYAPAPGWSPPVPPPPAYGPAPAPLTSWTPTATPAPPSRDPTALPRDYAPTYRMPPYGYPPVRFQCPYCGWVEAKYEAGRFTCLRCGRTA